MLDDDGRELLSLWAAFDQAHARVLDHARRAGAPGITTDDGLDELEIALGATRAGMRIADEVDRIEGLPPGRARRELADAVDALEAEIMAYRKSMES